MVTGMGAGACAPVGLVPTRRPGAGAVKMAPAEVRRKARARPRRLRASNGCGEARAKTRSQERRVDEIGRSPTVRRSVASARGAPRRRIADSGRRREGRKIPRGGEARPIAASVRRSPHAAAERGQAMWVVSESDGARRRALFVGAGRCKGKPGVALFVAWLPRSRRESPVDMAHAALAPLIGAEFDNSSTRRSARIETERRSASFPRSRGWMSILGKKPPAWRGCPGDAPPCD